MLSLLTRSRYRKVAADVRFWQSGREGGRQDIGRYAFRIFNFDFTTKARGKSIVMARAINKIGQSQTTELILNPAGYHHNVIHAVTLNVA